LGKRLQFDPARESAVVSVLDFEADRSYGFFNIWVFKTGRDPRNYRIGKTGLSKIRNGSVVWNFDPAASLWDTAKLYGSNVVLNYITDYKNRRRHPAHPDKGWILLDSALSAMAGALPGGGVPLSSSTSRNGVRTAPFDTGNGKIPCFSIGVIAQGYGWPIWVCKATVPTPALPKGTLWCVVGTRPSADVFEIGQIRHGVRDGKWTSGCERTMKAAGFRP
jgi:hypothetical protein